MKPFMIINLLLYQGQDLIIGNVGDSRAVMGTRDKDNSLTAVQLTVDLKPSIPGIHTSRSLHPDLLNEIDNLCYYLFILKFNEVL